MHSKRWPPWTSLSPQFNIHTVPGDALTGGALLPAADVPGTLPWPAGALGPQLLWCRLLSSHTWAPLQRTVLSWQKPPPREPPLEVKTCCPSPPQPFTMDDDQQLGKVGIKALAQQGHTLWYNPCSGEPHRDLHLFWIQISAWLLS